MRIKFTLLERTIIGADNCRTMYETSIDVRSNPAFKATIDQIKEDIRKELGIREITPVYMTFIVRQTAQLGVMVPAACYTLVIVERDAITRLPESFIIQR